MTKADAGTYTCVAENPFGKANDTTHVVVTGRYTSQGSPPEGTNCVVWTHHERKNVSIVCRAGSVKVSCMHLCYR